MKRTLLILAVLLCSCLSGMAQSNLRRQTLPAPYSRFQMYVCDTTGVQPGSAGNAQEWSFVNLIRRGNDSTSTIYTDRTLLTPSLRAKFPTAEVVVVDDTTTSMYRIVNNQWRLDGWVTPTTEFLAGVDPYDVRPSEIVFNDRRFDIFNGSLTSPFPTPGAKNVTGSHEYIYDGFGRLNLPDYNYYNVARVSQRDTMSAEVTIGMQKGFVKMISHRTFWQEITSNIPLFIIDQSTVQVFNSNNVSLLGPFTYKTVRYRRFGDPTTVNEDPSQSLQVAPCPSTGDDVTVIGLHTDPKGVILINSIGEQIPCAVTNSDAGMKIDTRSLAKGSYAVLIIEGQGMRTASFVKD